MAASGFELPFQWDDGTFVSPFVRSSGESLQDVGGFLAAFLIKKIAHLTENRHTAVEVTVTDLGCGDGQALFDLCPTISSAIINHNEVTVPVTVFGRGVDLDEGLVDIANQRIDAEMDKKHGDSSALVSSSSSLPQVTVRYAFEVADICAMHVDDIVTQAADVNNDNIARIHVVFVFLLTSALEQLQSLVTELLPKVEFFVSNSWTVPYLEGSPVAIGKMGSCFVYRDPNRDH